MQFLRRVCLLVASLGLVAMTLVTVVDVSARYLLNRPVYGSGEMVQYLLAITVFAGLFIVNQEKGHVSVTLLEGVFLKHIPKTYAFIFHFVTLVGMLGINGILVWQLFDYLDYPETSVVLGLPMHWIITITLFFGCASVFGAAHAAVQDIRAHRASRFMRSPNDLPRGTE